MMKSKKIKNVWLSVSMGLFILGCQQNETLKPSENIIKRSYFEIISKDKYFELVSKNLITKPSMFESIVSIRKNEADNLYFINYQKKSHYNKVNIKHSRIVILEKDGKKAIWGRVGLNTNKNKKADFTFLKNENIKFYDGIKYLTKDLYRTNISTLEEPYISKNEAPISLHIYNTFGLVNANGKEIFPPREGTSVGLSSWVHKQVVSVHTPKKGTAIYNADGTILMPFGRYYTYSTIVDNNKYIKVIKRKDNIEYFGYINLKGKEVIPAKYRVVTPLRNGVFRVVLHGKEGLYLNGKEIVPCRYAKVYLFPSAISTDGKVKVRKNNGEKFWFNISSQKEEPFETIQLKDIKK